ncbi:MAG: di-heme oxidoredictase family protein [bacterium]
MKARSPWWAPALAGGLWACDDEPAPEEADAAVAEGIFASPGAIRPNATAEERATFERGLEVATRRFAPAEGLGPRFNLVSCAGCHEKPLPGGAAGHYRDFYIAAVTLPDGSYIPAQGTMSGVLDSFFAEGGPRPRPEEAANTFGLRNPIPFFGVGLLAELPEEAILKYADPDDADGDGISGRPNYDRGFVGRFGMKSQTVSIEGFIRGPLNNHLGLTTDPLTPDQQARLPVPSVAAEAEEAVLREGLAEGPVTSVTFHQAAAPASPLTDDDDVPDPELSGEDLFDLVAFSMLLAAPKPEDPTPETERGRATFGRIGCAACHVPTLVGPRGALPVYSDLLLHDMGESLADGIQMGVATGSEFRTAPLWGVAATAPYLHDGRAMTLGAAIELHDGEGKRSRDAYVALGEAERAEVLAFLESLGGREVYSAGLIRPGVEAPGLGEMGGPLRPLSGEEASQWALGRSLFDRDHGFEDGLGPVFNGDSCRACHFDPMIGGAGPLDVNVMRHGTLTDAAFTAPARGTILHRFSAHGPRPEADGENVFEPRQTPQHPGHGPARSASAGGSWPTPTPKTWTATASRGGAHSAGRPAGSLRVEGPGALDAGVHRRRHGGGAGADAPGGGRLDLRPHRGRRRHPGSRALA